MINLFGPLRHLNSLCFETNGGGGGGGGSSKDKDKSSSSKTKTDYSGTNFGTAFKDARADLGPGQEFTYNGKKYSTATAEERPDLSGGKKTSTSTPPPAPPPPTRGPDDGTRGTSTPPPAPPRPDIVNRDDIRAPAPPPPAPPPPTRGPDDGTRGTSTPPPAPTRPDIVNRDDIRAPAPPPPEGRGTRIGDRTFVLTDDGRVLDAQTGAAASSDMAAAVREKLNPSLTLDDIIGGQSQYDPTGGGVNPSYVEDGTRGFLTDSNRVVSQGIDTLVPPSRQRPDISNRTDLLATVPPPGQTGRSDTFQQLYGYDPLDITAERARELSGPELADLLLARDDTDLTGQLMRTNPEFFLPSNNQQTVMASGQVLAGTPGAQTTSRDVFMQDEVQTLIQRSPEAQEVYQTLDLVPFVENMDLGVSFGGGPTDFRQVTKYRDPQGNVYSAAEAANYIQSGGAQSTTLPGGYEVITSFDQRAAPPDPVSDLGLNPVDLAIPISLVGSGGGGGGSAGGGAGRGDPRDFGFVAEEAAASRGSRPGIEGLIDRSPTAGQPAATSVPQASDIILPVADAAPGVTRESPPRLVPPSADSVPDVDVTVTRPGVVGGDTDADEDVEVTIDTGDGFSSGQEEDTGTTRDEDAGVPGGTDGDQGAGEGVEVDIGAGDDEGAGTGGEGTGAGTGTGEGVGPGTGTGTGTGEGAGDGSGTGDGVGPGTGTGTGGGTGTGEDTEQDVEVVVDRDSADEDEDEDEEPLFECPDGFRTVQMANGGFTCIPDMVRPRVGPYTPTIDVSPLEGRTPFRPGARRT